MHLNPGHGKRASSAPPRHRQPSRKDGGGGSRRSDEQIPAGALDRVPSERRAAPGDFERAACPHKGVTKSSDTPVREKIRSGRSAKDSTLLWRGKSCAVADGSQSWIFPASPPFPAHVTLRTGATE